MSFLHSHTATTTTSSTTTKISTSEKKIVLGFGINNYPDPANRLAGCVNDAIDWGTFLKDYHGFTVQTMFDKQATTKNFREITGNTIASAKARDYIVVTYSGHGSNVLDANGDEEDGRDECICLYDRFFIDDEIRELFKAIHPEATLVFISDSCHSGTVTRAFMNAMGEESIDGERLRARYLPPMDDNEAFNIVNSNVKSRIFMPEAGMNEILIAGCLPTEYSYDARINGRDNGAMSALALQVLRKNRDITFNDFYKNLRNLLPNQRYPQTPQLEGSDTNKNRLMFQNQPFV